MRHTRIDAPEDSRTRPRGRRTARALLLAFCLGLALGAPGTSSADEYDPQKAGNPLKIVYYVVYPIGWTLDVLIFRPAYYIGQCEPFQTIFGTDRHPEDPEPAPSAEADRR